ncbi:hypothetical protein [Haloarcula argentinensis]|uniref:Uncharacterized protein n=1 Tax=Haloarcula argentinensis TaxID=43776 RepID=A0A847ULL6_HALAR|nr:hypothetical protein [Haloarcula argentinensis]NLV12634.1 hypothetical protein [Haloarcula argentinensis]
MDKDDNIIKNKNIIKFTAVICLLVLSWYVRVFPNLDDPGLVGGYGATHDWSRFHIVSTGTTDEIPNAITEVSKRMSIRTDLATYLLAVLTLISGETELTSSIRFLQLLPNLTFMYLSLIGTLTYKRISRKKDNFSDIDAISVFALGLFVSGLFINYTENAMRFSGYGICIFSLLVYIMFRIQVFGKDSRIILIFSIFVGMSSVFYHTQALLALLIVPSYYLLTFTYNEAISKKGSLNGNHLKLFILSGTIMIGIGIYYSHTVNDLLFGFVRIFADSPERTESFKNAQTGVLRAALRLDRPLTEIISAGSKALLRLAYVGVIGYFLISTYIRDKFDKTEKFVLTMLLLYPIVLIMFYSYGGLGIGIRRTAISGTPIIIMVAALLLANAKERRKKIAFRLIIGALIILSVGTQISHVGEPQSHTNSEVNAVQFAGENVATNEFIYTEPTLGSALTYYSHRGVTFVRPIRLDWENRLRHIYFSSDHQKNRQAIESTVRVQTTSSVSESDYSDHYLLTTKRLQNRGISLESLTYYERPPPKFYSSFDRGYNRVYHSGNGLLYKSN